MSKKRIDHWSWFYEFLKRTIIGFSIRKYFKKFTIKNEVNIPENAPVILAPNHQNALLDALAIVCGNKYQSIFIARADIFNSPLLVAILTFLKMLPMYRMRDGAENLKKNDEIFNMTLDILRRKTSPITIFAEGNHGEYRRLRPLVKGIFRMAFKAQEDYGTDPGVKIVPVGLDYGHYQKFRSTLLINYGKPVEVSEYYQLYAENNALGINALRDRLSEEMKKYMIHIPSEANYGLYMDLRIVYNDSMREKLGISSHRLWDKFKADQEMISVLNAYEEKHPEKVEIMNSKMQEYMKGLNELKLRDWVLKKKRYSYLIMLLHILGLILFFPLFLVGIAENYLPYKMPLFFTSKIKDPQFVGTFKYGLGLVFFILYYLILTILILIFVPFWWLKLIGILTLPFTGQFAFNYFISVKKLRARCRYNFFSLRKNKKLQALQKLRQEIIGTMDEIYDLSVTTK
jgi:1-acyl-sn-glycerol-3-phosphate acyltransferase